MVRRHLNLTWAPTGAGKSLFAFTAALAIAAGGSAFGWGAPRPNPVLYVDGEMDVADLKERAQMLLPTVRGGDHEAAKSNFQMLARHDQEAGASFPDIATEEGRADVVKAAKEQGSALVVLDNLSTLATMDDENAASSFNPVIELMNELKGYGAAVMVIHHANKAGSGYRGSSKIAATFESIIELVDKRAGGFGPAHFEAKWEKMRGDPQKAGRPLQAKLETVEGDPEWELQEGSIGRLNEMVRLVRSCAYSTQSEIAGAMGVAKQRLSEWKQEAHSSGLITPADWRACLREAKEDKMEADHFAAYNDF